MTRPLIAMCSFSRNHDCSMRHSALPRITLRYQCAWLAQWHMLFETTCFTAATNVGCQITSQLCCCGKTGTTTRQTSQLATNWQTEAMPPHNPALRCFCPDVAAPSLFPPSSNGPLHHHKGAPVTLPSASNGPTHHHQGAPLHPATKQVLPRPCSAPKRIACSPPPIHSMQHTAVPQQTALSANRAHLEHSPRGRVSTARLCTSLGCAAHPEREF